MMPCKRRRESPLNVQFFVDEAYQAVTTSQRLRLLHQLEGIFDGTELVRAGIMRPLCLQLGFVLNLTMTKSKDNDQISMVCGAIDSLVKTCRDDVRIVALGDVGTELLRLLSKTWRVKHNRAKVLSIWRSVSLSARGSMMLAHRPDFIPMIADVVQDTTTSKDMKDDCVCILKYVSLFAEDHRLSLLEKLGTLLSQVSFSAMTERSMERLSVVFRNLSLTPNVRVAMTQHSFLLTALTQLCSHGNKNVKTLRNITSTFDNLSTETDSCLLLILHGDGVILDVLLRLLLSEEDEVVRRRCARAMRLLARDKAVPLLVKANHVMRSLHQVAIHDRSREVRGEAATAYASCASKVTADMEIHLKVLDSLAELAHGPTPASIAMAFREQVENATNRVAIAAHGHFLETMIGMCQARETLSSVKEYVCSALEVLSQDERLREVMLGESMLNFLVQCALRGEGSSSHDAVHALLNLAAVETARKQLVTHRGVLHTLIRYSKTCQDSHSKESVKNAMMMMIPQL